MKGGIHIYIYVCLLALVACQPLPEIELRIRRCADIPVPVASAMSGAIGGKGYVFGGREQSGVLNNTLWQYDPQTDTWQPMGETPLRARVRGVMQAHGEDIYIGLGFNGARYQEQSYLRDFWRYNPATDSWTRLADFPSNNTVSPVSFTGEGKIYVLYGMSGMFSREVWEYDITTDTWQQHIDDWRRAKACAGMAGAMVGGQYFLGSGYDTRNLAQWWEVDLKIDNWTQCPDIPTGGRNVATAVGNNRYAYLMGGRHFGGTLTDGFLYEDILRYAPNKRQWEQCGTLPFGAAENMIGFAIDEKVYFGLGEDAKGQINKELYCIEE